MWGGDALWGNHYHTVIVEVVGVSNALEIPMTLTAGNALYTDPVPAGGVRAELHTLV